LGAAADGRLKAEADHRLGRIVRKMNKESVPDARPARLGYDGDDAGDVTD
jgi:hypothetical protein